MSFFAVKDPDAVKDYGIDWTDWLNTGDTISASAWTVSGPDAALTDSSPTFTTTQTKVVLSGGTAGRRYDVTNHVTTAAGLEDDRTITIYIQEL